MENKLHQPGKNYYPQKATVFIIPYTIDKGEQLFTLFPLLCVSIKIFSEGIRFKESDSTLPSLLLSFLLKGKFI
jgi:hypothetical protein